MERLSKIIIILAVLAIAAFSCKKEKEKEVTLASIAVTTQPTNKTYWEGDEFDPAGMVVTATYSDNSKAPVTVTADMLTYNFATAGDKTVTITYMTKTAEVTGITVNAVTLVSITVTGEPTKKTYEFGEPFLPAGLIVTAKYSNDKTEDIPLTHPDLQFVYDFESAGNNKTITVKFTYRGVTKELKIEGNTGITVNDPAVSSILISPIQIDVKPCVGELAILSVREVTPADANLQWFNYTDNVMLGNEIKQFICGASRDIVYRLYAKYNDVTAYEEYTVKAIENPVLSVSISPINSPISNNTSINLNGTVWSNLGTPIYDWSMSMYDAYNFPFEENSIGLTSISGNYRVDVDVTQIKKVRFHLHVNTMGYNCPISAVSNEITIVAPPDVTPPTVANGTIAIDLITVPSPARVKVSWNAATDNVTTAAKLKYFLYAAPTETGLDNAIASKSYYRTTTGTTIVEILLTDLQQQFGGALSGYFTVVVEDEAGNTSKYSIQSYPPAQALVISNLHVENMKQTAVQIKYDLNQTANIYHAIYTGSAQNLTEVQVKAALGAVQNELEQNVSVGNGIIRSFSNLTPNTQYTMYLVAENTNGTSNVAHITFTTNASTTDTEPPTVADKTITVTNRTRNSIAIEWEKATDNVTPQNKLRYYVFAGISQSQLNGFVDTNTAINSGGTIDIDSFNRTGLTQNLIIWFTVVVEDEAGNRTRYTDGSATTLP